MPVKHSPGGNTPSNTTRSGEWLFSNQSGLGPTSQTDWYSSQGKPSSGGLLFLPGPSVYKYSNLTSDKLNVISKVDNRDYKRNHSKGKWVCVQNDSVVASNPNSEPVNIIEELPNQSSSIVKVIGPMQTDTISVQSPNLYYSQSGLPVGFKATGSIYTLISLGLQGKEFAHYSNRYGATTFFLYNPNESSTDVFFFVAGNGIEGSADSTITIPGRNVVTFSNSLENTWRYFYSPSSNICMSAQESSGDKVIMPPASRYIYKRRNDERTAMDGSSPDINGSFNTFDPKKCAAIEIADGAGGDATMHLGIENLSNRYTIGIPLSDYHITSPFSNEIEVYYKDSQGGWSLFNQHTFSGGSLTSIAGQVGVDGDGGGFDDSGGAPNLENGADMWFFRGTSPFLLTVNDLSSDEETLLGWMSNENTSFFPSVSQLNDYLETRDDLFTLE